MQAAQDCNTKVQHQQQWHSGVLLGQKRHPCMPYAIQLSQERADHLGNPVPTCHGQGFSQFMGLLPPYIEHLCPQNKDGDLSDDDESINITATG
jgi:hypothetical protein